MNPARLIVADDEPDILDLVRRTLEREGFQVETAVDGAAAMLAVQEHLPDLAILDNMMPNLTGLDVCRALRRSPATAGIPLIMLSARSSEIDRVVAFELGVDDFVTKPFSPRELLLRVHAILRHRRPKGEARADECVLGALRLLRGERIVTVDGEPVALTGSEFKLLQVLVETPEVVHTRESLLDLVWGDERIELRSIDTQVRRLRAKLGRAASQIETVRAFGYRATANATE